MSPKLTVLKLTVLVLMGLTSTSAQAKCEVARVTASDLAEGDRFGNAVAIFGDVAAVGAPFDDDACPTDRFCQSGSAHVFEIGGLIDR